MNMIVTGTVPSAAADVATALRSSDVECDSVRWDERERHDTSGTRGDERRTVIVYRDPRTTVVSQMKDGDPWEALEQWTLQTSALLRRFRKYRRHSVVIPETALWESTDRVLSLLQFDAGTVIFPQDPSLQSVDPMLLLIAGEYVRNSDSASSNWNELVAASDPALVAASPRLEPSVLLQQYQSLRSNDNELSQQLITLKAELQKKTTELGEVASKRAVLDKLIGELESDLTEKDRTCREIQEENDEILLQLHKVQELLEHEYLARDEIVTFALTLEKRYEGVLKSKSWAVMKPIRLLGRGLRRLFRGRRVPRNALPKRPASIAEWIGTS